MAGAVTVVLASCATAPPKPSPMVQTIQLVAPKPKPRVVYRVRHKINAPRSAKDLSQAAGAIVAGAASQSSLAVKSEPGPPPEDGGLSATSPPALGGLIGLNSQAVTGLFGSASETVVQSPATIWRYMAENCTLQLTFYLDLKRGEMRTLRSQTNVQTDDQWKACAQAIIRAKHQG